MRIATLKNALAGALVLLGIATASAQQVRFFPDFNPVTSPTTALQTNGGVVTSNGSQYVLRLTQGWPGTGPVYPESAAVWFKIPQVVNAGFTTYFRFQIHNAKICCTPGDGLAFVVQNATSDSTYGATGAGITARGVGNGGLGYTGLRNNLAVEFDTHQDFQNNLPWDPNANHVAVQSCGTSTNGPVHESGTFTIDHNPNVKSCLVDPPPPPGGCPSPGANPYGINCNPVPLGLPLGVTCNGSSCADGTPHDVVIEYAPVANVWTLKVYVDPTFIPNTHTPVLGSVPTISIPYNIDYTQNPATGLALATDSHGNKTSAFVGFTASQTQEPQAQDILAWEFTPHTPTSITQTIQGCPSGTNCTPPPTVFTFGGHDTKATLFQGYTNPNGDTMTVVATPISRSQFYQTRLKGTQYSYEQCIVYQGTGGNCIVYTITCHQADGTLISCPVSLNQCVNPGDPGCYLFETSYYTTDGVTMNNADYLKEDPIGNNNNNWVSIFTGFSATAFDPRTSGSGGTPSDFVATFAVGAKP